MNSKRTRNTEKQKLVKEILSTVEHTMSADDILAAMPIKVNKTTIYRILDRFIEKGDVHFVTGKNGKTYYALCNDGCGHSHKMHNHIHFECQECEEVTCLPNTIAIPNLPGFAPIETQFLVIGICNKCKK
ncbi:transcriptional repressor [Aquimarina sp. 2201CG1-2-11]|uniref:Fur family transcriptional regulator n=1 Tax=Aquimarina discodermiae TaxID=3231043 RepID=UPI003462313E